MATIPKNAYVCRLCGVAETTRLPPEPALAIYPLPEGWFRLTFPQGKDQVICRDCNALIVNAGSAELVAKLRTERDGLEADLAAALERPGRGAAGGQR